MLIEAIIASAMMFQGGQSTIPLQPEIEAQPVAQVRTLEDPAELLNLGVTLMQAGEIDAARLAFEKVRDMRVDYTLETTDGRWVEPEVLAQQGLAMLNRERIASR
ncbi:hypothetical protein [Alteriqipengyuania lutimaris]|uniref:Tetratricopeptide repeat protein n=1 Tax=Alteriqipengyuania lutimaris TaxID=1538146 RepID=A0A395LM74_9SPHN|nr:hypothetical protein [Alteriqipengyuania lutimaris]MBB3033132.1 hypothetical protein [Alteriqipengyuania lutimaris]RDS77809.1 hypothetical protein DL238_09470 [Alteriqipengyuania lutimaris]